MKRFAKLFLITALIAIAPSLHAMKRKAPESATSNQPVKKLTAAQANQAWAQWISSDPRARMPEVSPELVKSWITAGADVNTQSPALRETALYWTAYPNYPETVRQKIVPLLLGAGADANIANHLGDTPLHAAVRFSYGSPIIVRMLLNAGANVNAQNDMGTTPLMNAVYDDSPAIVHLLLDAGADRTITNRYGETAADIARQNGKQKILELLEPTRKIK